MQRYFEQPLSAALLETMETEQDRLQQMEHHNQQTLRGDRLVEIQFMNHLRRQREELRLCIGYARARLRAEAEHAERQLAMAMAFHPGLGRDTLVRRLAVPQEMAMEIGRQHRAPEWVPWTRAPSLGRWY